MIRLATEEDIPQILVLLGQILQLHHQVRPDMFKPEGQKFDEVGLKAYMSRDEVAVYVVVDEADQVLAHMFLEFKKPNTGVRMPKKSLYIEDLCVSQAARGEKIGQRLFDFAKVQAKKCGCYNLTLNVWNDNLGAYRFYEKQGMKPQQTQMELIL